jgi:hypothetical protein
MLGSEFSARRRKADDELKIQSLREFEINSCDSSQSLMIDEHFSIECD